MTLHISPKKQFSLPQNSEYPHKIKSQQRKLTLEKVDGLRKKLPIHPFLFIQSHGL